ncbi:hypothetical protein GCM10010289_55230 [Streptomyces violascens]|uniref:Uncharacterized protein n=1 Tax=Streptomyces violascens TaxID=67381 RepID=A0ABQ3QVI0_9ACTN|nr:hypothetical protein GCM10010289_55230 [Streptomyces violascens]GHI41260.1 hypothetical protein Sviol_56680 [Streptomyces violascens]
MLVALELPSAAVAAAGMLSERAAAPSRAVDAMRIAPMVDPPVPEEQLRNQFHIWGEMHLDARNARRWPGVSRPLYGERGIAIPRPA